MLTYSKASSVVAPPVQTAPRTCFGEPNLLIDPGFEELSVEQGLPKKTGVWSGDLAEVVNRQTLLLPIEGESMLAFRATRPTTSSPDDDSEVYQLVRVEDHPSLIGAPTSRLVACARFNRIFGVRTDSLFALTIRAYAGVPLIFDSAFRDGEHILGPYRIDMLTDSSTTTWQVACVDVPWTEPAGFVAVELAAYENVHNDDEVAEFAGHFVDDTCLSVVTK